jgi:hypothetical protein
MQHFHNVAFALDRDIERLIIKPVVTIRQYSGTFQSPGNNVESSGLGLPGIPGGYDVVIAIDVQQGK